MEEIAQRVELLPFRPRNETSFRAWVKVMEHHVRDNFAALPTENELNTLEREMNNNARIVLGSESDELKVNYTKCKQSLEKFGPEFVKNFFTAKIFMGLLNSGLGDPRGNIEVKVVMDFCRQCVQMERYKLHLAAEAKDNLQFITHDELGEYITETIRQFQWVKNEELEYVCCLAERKFAFFLDPAGNKKYSIDAVTHSGFAQELDAAGYEDQDNIRNWFSEANYRDTYKLFRELDKDNNGLISESELLDYHNLSPLFVKRVFEMTNVYEKPGEMDFKSFCDFHLSMSYVDDLCTYRYLFRIFDADGNGVLTLKDIREYVDSILNSIVDNGHDKIVDDHATVAAEVFDIVCKPGLDSITLKDIAISLKGGTFFKILTNWAEFIKYDTPSEGEESEDD